MKAQLETFFRRYFLQRNLEATLALMLDGVIGIGTGEREVAHGKAELRRLLEAEFDHLPNPIRYEVQDYAEMPIGEDAGSAFAGIRLWVEKEGGNLQTDVRLTCTCMREGGEWKIACLHMSALNPQQKENMFFSLEHDMRMKSPISANSGMKLVELMSQAIAGGVMGCYLEEGFPLYAINDRMLEILGYRYEELIAETGGKMMNIVHEEDRERVSGEIYRCFEETGEYQVEYRALGRDGRIVWVNDLGRKIIDENGREAMISIMTDISVRMEREMQLLRDAERDSLTNLYNRKKEISLIEEVLAQGDCGILFLCDVDHFKQINDTCGHVTGDQVLKQLARVMRRHAQGQAFIGRIGGDEYALYFPEKVSQRVALDAMQRIQAEFQENMRERIPALNDIALSIGGKRRTDGENLHALYQLADEALYRSKHNQSMLILK